VILLTHKKHIIHRRIFMKKITILLSTLALIGTLSVGCGGSTPTETSNTGTPTEATQNEANQQNETSTATNSEETSSTTEVDENANIAKVGFAHVTNISKSKSLGTDADGKDVLPVGQVDSVLVSVGFDKDDKVAKITIDTAQSKVNFDKELQLTSDTKSLLKTKVELGDDYGLISRSSIEKNWDEQIAALENWMIGKTVAEIKALKVKKVDDRHPSVPDVAELTSSVTITVQDYIAAVEKAFANAEEVSTPGTKLGMGHKVTIAKSKSLSTDADGKEVLPLADVNTDVVTTVFDSNDKVVATIIDTISTKVTFDKDGNVTADKTAEIKSKIELGDEYGLRKSSSIQKNWYEQAASLEEWMIGKTASEITGMKMKMDGDKATAVSDEPELTSSVTIKIANYLESLNESFTNAK
jgi:hypothetical protein